MKPFNISEYFKIKQKIEECDSFYAALYNLTEVNFSNEIETACINFDKNGNSLTMSINPHFWDTLNEQAKTFVILHELYHVVYDHGKRIINLGGDFHLGNIASDIVINHHIHEKSGVNREDFDWKMFYWVETSFPNQKDISTDKPFEFYYNKLSSQNKIENKQLLGSHSNGDELNNTSSQAVNDKSEFSPENFSNTFKDILEKNPELIDEIQRSPDFADLGDELKEYLPIHQKLQNKHSGLSTDFVKSDKKPNFNNLLKLLIPKQKQKDDIDLEMWVGTHRRYSSFLKQHSNILLPNIKEEEIFSGKDKKEVWIFMDSSGSCHGMFHVFSNIVMALLKEKSVNCRAFAFGDDCEEIDTKNHKISFYSGNAGGFDCIEEKIQEVKIKEKIKYPDNVVVLSDGGVTFGIKDKVEKPKNWVLLINNSHCERLTPKGGKYFKVDNDFFKLSNNNKKKP